MSGDKSVRKWGCVKLVTFVLFFANVERKPGKLGRSELNPIEL